MLKYFLILSMLGTASSLIYPHQFRNGLNAKNAIAIQNPYITFGEKIKRERLKKNWSLEQLAAAVHIPTTQLQDYEMGKKMPVKEIVYKIEAALNIVFD